MVNGCNKVKEPNATDDYGNKGEDRRSCAQKLG